MIKYSLLDIEFCKNKFKLEHTIFLNHYHYGAKYQQPIKNIY